MKVVFSIYQGFQVLIIVLYVPFKETLLENVPNTDQRWVCVCSPTDLCLLLARCASLGSWSEWGLVRGQGVRAPLCVHIEVCMYVLYVR